jgi:hypothetical protein
LSFYRASLRLPLVPPNPHRLNPAWRGSVVRFRPVLVSYAGRCEVNNMLVDNRPVECPKVQLLFPVLHTRRKRRASFCLFFALAAVTQAQVPQIS